ncbi:hypothetical protein B9Z52_11345 [Limnohabitans sp. Jir72]|nr:hypothetical protein B9Z52_11345 [Limnohabitans sp. Jir72]
MGISRQNQIFQEKNFSKIELFSIQNQVLMGNQYDYLAHHMLLIRLFILTMLEIKSKYLLSFHGHVAISKVTIALQDCI